jgi:IMP dehydrogenase
MKEVLSFDDVLIVPQYSNIASRKDVDTTSFGFKVPVIASNMDTITGHAMATAMGKLGAGACLHRFSTVQENIDEFKKSPKTTMVSIGIGAAELERAIWLFESGATYFVIDVAHGAAAHVVQQYNKIRSIVKDNASIMVGNFATQKNIDDFNHAVNTNRAPDSYKVGIGGGSLCTTRVVTGCGLPTLASVQDCARTNAPIIADGGIRNSGDIVKALAAGASAVMVGSLLSGTEETPGDIVAIEKKNGVTTTFDNITNASYHLWHKKYRGSASLESYGVQGKVASHRAPEGEATLVRYKGKVEDIIQNLMGGLRSGMSYVGASTIEELQKNTQFVRITDSGKAESRAHAKG